MKKLIKIMIVSIFAIFLVLQVFQTDKTQVPVVESETIEAAAQVPADISQIIGRSCNDCHSNKTVYPWYAYVQPFGWLLEGHIKEGREEMNLSVFNTYSDSKKAKKLEKICEEVEAGAMPLPSYLWIHGDAALSQSDKTALCDWANTARARFGEQ